MPHGIFRICEFTAHTADVNCLNIGKKSGQVLVTGGDDQVVNLWKIGKSKNILSLPGHKTPVASVAFDSREEVVVSGSAGGSIKVFDLAAARVARSLRGHRTACMCVDFHAFGNFVASGSQDSTVKIWDLQKKALVHTYYGHTAPITTVTFSPHGQWLVSGDADGVVKLWELSTHKLLHQFAGHSDAVTGLRFHPVERVLATSSADRTVKTWDLDSFGPIASTLPDTTRVRALAFTPDGTHAVAATQQGVRLWTWQDEVRQTGSADAAWHGVRDLVIRGRRGVGASVPTADQQLIGVEARGAAVAVWGADMSTFAPYASGDGDGGRGGGDGPAASPVSNPRRPRHGRSPLKRAGSGTRDRPAEAKATDGADTAGSPRARRRSLGPLNPAFAEEPSAERALKRTGMMWTASVPGDTGEAASAAGPEGRRAARPRRVRTSLGSTEASTGAVTPTAGAVGAGDGRSGAPRLREVDDVAVAVAAERHATNRRGERGEGKHAGERRAEGKRASPPPSLRADAGVRASPLLHVPSPGRQVPGARAGRSAVSDDSDGEDGVALDVGGGGGGRADTDATVRRPATVRAGAVSRGPRAVLGGGAGQGAEEATAVRTRRGGRSTPPRGGGEAGALPKPAFEGAAGAAAGPSGGLRLGARRASSEREARRAAAAAVFADAPGKTFRAPAGYRGGGGAAGAVTAEGGESARPVAAGNAMEAGPASPGPKPAAPHSSDGDPAVVPRVARGAAGASPPPDGAGAETARAARPSLPDRPARGAAARAEGKADSVEVDAPGQSGHGVRDISRTPPRAADATVVRAAPAGAGGADTASDGRAALPESGFGRRPRPRRTPTAAASTGGGSGFAANKRAVAGRALVPSVRDRPVGLSVSAFVAPRLSRPSARQAPDAVRRALVHGAGGFAAEMQRRRDVLAALAAAWGTDGAAAALARLRAASASDTAPVADVARAVDWRGRGVNLEACALALPLMVGLVGGQFEDHVLTGLQATSELVSVFGAAVVKTMRLHRRGGPAQKDVVWEERVENAKMSAAALRTIALKARSAAGKGGLVGRCGEEVVAQLDVVLGEIDTAA